MTDPPQPITFRDDEGREWRILAVSNPSVWPNEDPRRGLIGVRYATSEDLELSISEISRKLLDLARDVAVAQMRTIARQNLELEALRALEKHIRRFIAPRMGQERRWAPSMDGVTGDLLRAIDEAREGKTPTRA